MASSTSWRPAALAMLLPAACLAQGSWMGLDPEPAPPPAAAPAPADLVGLARLEPADPTPYHHPFSATTRATVQALAAATPAAGQSYLVLSVPGPAPQRANRAWNRAMTRWLEQNQLAPIEAPPQGGAPHAPLMAVVRAGDELEAAPRIPGNLRLVSAEGARVRLCLIDLGAEGAPLEVGLAESPQLDPAAALAAARQAYQRARAELAPGRTLDAEALARLPAAALAAFGPQVPDQLILALRVLWKSGDAWVPGPGGLMVNARNPGQASQQLFRLYAR